jgi:hypothetical protein
LAAEAPTPERKKEASSSPRARRQQLLGIMVLMGIHRIVVTDGKR